MRNPPTRFLTHRVIREADDALTVRKGTQDEYVHTKETQIIYDALIPTATTIADRQIKMFKIGGSRILF